METREYLHGPLEAVSEEYGCIVFGRRRERELAAALASYGATVMLVTDGGGGGHVGGDGRGAGGEGAAVGATVLELPSVPALAAPILQILPVQLLVDHVARVRGLEIGTLRRQQQDTKVS
jgi:fructoselysine-6-P-deglycase FrlB-like protein